MDEVRIEYKGEVVRENRRSMVLALLFGLVSALAGFDLVTDIDEGISTIHLVTESLVVLIGLVGLATMIRSLNRTAKDAKRFKSETESLTTQLAVKGDEAKKLTDRLAIKTEEAKRWREEARTLIAGLGEAIDKQFERWGLTEAEKEVALLLLKGLSHKEIAEIRGTSESTNRQQARSVYKKADLSGRNDLTAFFLEDLLLPHSSPED